MYRAVGDGGGVGHEPYKFFGDKSILSQTGADNTEEDGRKIKNIYIKKNCTFSLNLMVKIGK